MKRAEREARSARFMAWHMLAPHAGRNFPKLDEYVNGKPKRAVTMSVGDSLDRWAALANGGAPDIRL